MDKQWNLEKIKQHVSGKIQENLHLEYKACADLLGNVNLPELTKDVSAFANADGGTLIFGVCEGNQKDNTKHVPIAIDQGFERSGKVNANWLENILLSNIAPKIQGLKPYEIDLENGNFILVLEVPQSQYGPHMAKDNKYHRRRQTKAEPMEHYEVEDVRNRSRGPLLRLKVPFYPIAHVFKGNTNHFFHLELENLVSKPAEYGQIIFYVDSRLNNVHSEYFVKMNKEVLTSEFNLDIQGVLDLQAVYSGLLQQPSAYSQISFVPFSTKFGLPQSQPVWNGCPINLKGISFNFPQGSGSKTYFFGWQILAPYMAPQKYFYYFHVNAHSSGGHWADYQLTTFDTVNEL